MTGLSKLDQLGPTQKPCYCSHLQITDISNVFVGVGSTECQLAVYGRLGDSGFEGHSEKILFDCPLGKEAVRDSRDFTLVERQVGRANTTEHAVDANAVAEKCLSSPQDPVKGRNTRGVNCNTDGLLRCSKTWDNRHGVGVQITWGLRVEYSKQTGLYEKSNLPVKLPLPYCTL